MFESARGRVHGLKRNFITAMPADALLHILADGKFHSGQDLAERFAISRTAIWKKVQLLESAGISVERIRSKGYRIPGGLDLLGDSTILSLLESSNARLILDLQVFSQIDSTNAEIQRRQVPVNKAVVCLAESQSAGRGRRGRNWVSPFASSIYCSVGWTFDGGAEILEGLSLAVGVVVCETLESLGVDALALKWPNDVLRDGRKLAGVLIEMQGDLSGPLTAVIGVGVNVRMPADAAQRIEQPWNDLQGSTEPVSRNAIAARLLNNLLPMLANYASSGFEYWRERWLQLDAYADAPVIVHHGTQSISGTARGVDSRGALLLETASGVQTLHGGEVSLRRRT